MVFLRGAVDGLSVVVPYAEPGYHAARSSIALPPPGNTGGALDLDGRFGLHPALACFAWQNTNTSLKLDRGIEQPMAKAAFSQWYAAELWSEPTAQELADFVERLGLAAVGAPR